LAQFCHRFFFLTKSTMPLRELVALVRPLPSLTVRSGGLFSFGDSAAAAFSSDNEAEMQPFYYMVAVLIVLALAAVGARAVWHNIHNMLSLVSRRPATTSVGTQTTFSEKAHTARETSTSVFRLDYLTVDQLKFILQKKQLPVSGLKCELIERLTKASQQPL
jgi:hypothetical protein